MFTFASLLISLLENTLDFIKNSFKDGASSQRLVYMLLLNELWSSNDYEWSSSDGKLVVPEWTKIIKLLFALTNVNTRRAQATAASRDLVKRTIVIGRMLRWTSSGEQREL